MCHHNPLSLAEARLTIFAGYFINKLLEKYNISSHKQQLHGRFGGTAFGSVESLPEEPELVDPSSECVPNSHHSSKDGCEIEFYLLIIAFT